MKEYLLLVPSKFYFPAGRILVIFLLSFPSLFCERPIQNKKENCEGPIYLEINGAVTDVLCIQTINKVFISDSTLFLEATKTSLEGTSKFTLSLYPWKNLSHYSFNDFGKSECELAVRGITDEFYKCKAGSCTIRHLDKNSTLINITAKLSGFYNKKEITISGKIRLENL